MNNKIKKIGYKTIFFVYGIYVKIANYFYISNFRKQHITFGIIDGKFHIARVNHEDFIVQVKKKIAKIGKTNNRTKFIKLALQEALSGCNYIIFTDPDKIHNYVQFWTGEHTLKYSFFANEYNEHKDYYLSTVGLLSELGYANSKIENFKGRMIYKVKKETGIITIDANFYKDIDLATDFTEKIFSQIFKTKSKKLEVNLG